MTKISEKRKIYLKKYREENRVYLLEYAKEYNKIYSINKKLGLRCPISVSSNPRKRIPINANERRCCVCFVVKPLDDFSRNSTKPLGRSYQCKICMKKIRPSYESKRDIVKVMARRKLQHAVASGAIKRQPCSVCKDPNTHGHHEDYSQPLNVIWLCKKHHDEIHRNKKQNIQT